jgi:DNA-binding CsgD family transcriptional regulator
MSVTPGVATTTPPLELVGARRRERLLVRVRYLMAAVLVGMVALFSPATVTGALVVVGALLGANVVAHSRLDHLASAGQVHALGRRLTVVDVLAGLATYGLFLLDPAAMPVALLAFVTFELTLRWGATGTLVGLGGFAVALAVRAQVQTSVLPEGAVRPALLLLWAAVAVLLTALAHELRAQDTQRRAALEARERIADDLRATVSRALAQAGIDESLETHGEVLEAVHRILEGASDDREALIERIATVLTVPHHGLSTREQEILLLLARGHPDARIARALFISPSTVRNHLHNMRRKLDLASRDELVEFASRYAPGS